MSLILLSASSLSGCVDDEKNRFSLTCFDAEETVEVHDGLGVLTYTDSIPGLKLASKEFFITDTNVEEFHLPLSICNPEDFQILNTSLDTVSIKFQGIIEVLPETIDAFSIMIQLEVVQLQ
ncbi:hypothetical protein [Algoriphagus sp. NG3]|uniref:hypothetical protein n=1 Tax=Algoriphagus sp. NG3 TaxID=3097546 RepID=UPI002A7FA282|nr:hypothetical protein [Algoriphagus sp. NG3]WPR75491.1 hypothetical protein SLW71_22800 [Algoriphagus sp. NG3]